MSLWDNLPEEIQQHIVNLSRYKHYEEVNKEYKKKFYMTKDGLCYTSCCDEYSSPDAYGNRDLRTPRAGNYFIYKETKCTNCQNGFYMSELSSYETVPKNYY